MPTGYTVDEEKKQRIIDAHVKHKVPVSKLSEAYNVNRKTIYKWLKEADVKKDDDKTSDKEAEGTSKLAAGDAAKYEPVNLSKDEKNAALEELNDVGNETTKAMDHDLSDRGLHGDDTAARAAAATEAEHKENAVKAAEEAEAEDKEEPKESDCPNPSCESKDFDGEECGKCGYRSDAMVNPFARTAK